MGKKHDTPDVETYLLGNGLQTGVRPQFPAHIESGLAVVAPVFLMYQGCLSKLPAVRLAPGMGWKPQQAKRPP
jgi:hypothetical protein